MGRVLLLYFASLPKFKRNVVMFGGSGYQSELHNIYPF
jgi:hypothetical protein